jgi:hypothetical protein
MFKWSIYLTPKLCHTTWWPSVTEREGSQPNMAGELFALTTDSVTPGLQHVDCDYSCAYVTVYTEGDVQGHGLTFTIGRGNEIGKWKAIG